MDARYVQRGDAIDYTPVVDVSSGDVVGVGRLMGVAKLDIKAGELGALALTGVYEMAKSPGVVFTAGAEVSWDPSGRNAVATGSSDSVKIGHAVAAAKAGDTTVLVRLCQGLA